MGRYFLFLFLLIVCADASALSLCRYKGLKGIIYIENDRKINIVVKSRHELSISEDCPRNVRNFFETMWVTERGRKAVVHLLKSKSKITVLITDSIGAFTFDKDVDFMYAITGPDWVNGKKKTMKEYDGKPTWEAMSILLCKGTYNLAHYDTALLNQNKVIVIDYDKGDRLVGTARDSAIAKLKKQYYHNDSLIRGLIKEKKVISDLQRETDPNGEAFLYKTCREFYFLSGIHEIVHTTTKNIALSRKLKDCESDAYKAERKAKRKLRKVIRNKALAYSECD